MNWLKLLRYDIRSGLLRWRYLSVPLIFCLPCFYCWIYGQNVGNPGTWMDYVAYCFKGLFRFDAMDSFELPILWFLVMAGCLFLNLDYPINDLTDAGQQIIVRFVSKRGWFYSKCVWNLLSSLLYMLLGALTALIFALAGGGTAGLIGTSKLLWGLQIYVSGAASAGETLLAALVLPGLTLAAFNMLQMTLTLIMKPIFGFLICICMLIISLFFSSPYLLGNGAMTARSGILIEGCVAPLPAVLTCLGIIAVSVVIGMIRFDRMDHLRYEE